MNGISIVLEDKTIHYWPLPLLQRATRVGPTVYLDFVQERHLVEVTEDADFLWERLRGYDRHRTEEHPLSLDPQVNGRLIQRPPPMEG